MTDVDIEEIVDLDLDTEEVPEEMSAMVEPVYRGDASGSDFRPQSLTADKPKRKKSGGRKKGVKNKAKRFDEDYINDALTTTRCCPVRSLVRVGRKAEKEGQYSSAIKAYSDILGYIKAKPRAPLVAIESKGNLVFKWKDEAEKQDEPFIIDQTSGDRE